MTAPAGDRPLRLTTAAACATMLLDLVPLVALLPASADAGHGFLGGAALLPVVVLPTVVLAALCSRPVYRVQLAIASLVCLVVVFVGFEDAGAVLAAGVTTIGTLVFITVLIGRSRTALRHHLHDLHRVAVTDPLTGVLNRRGALAALPELIAAAKASGREIGLAALDLDHFKEVNDRYGHAAGDDVLRGVCAIAQQAVGTDGVVVRSGGEELLLMTVGDATGAARRLMDGLTGLRADPAITASVGVVRAEPEALGGSDELWAAVDIADLALYRAKALGRDRVVDGGDYFGAPRGAGRHGRTDDDADEDAAGWRDTPAGAAAGGPGPATAVDAAVRRPAASGTSAWRQAVARAKARRIDRRTHALYRLIVAWTMVVGMISTVQQVLTGSSPAAQLWIALPVGWAFGTAVIVGMGRLTTSWALTPVFAAGSLFETAVVFTVGAESKPSALMLSLLVGLLVVLQWPRSPLVVQCAVAVVACIGAAVVPGRTGAQAAIVATLTAAGLLTALAIVAAVRRREEDAEEELRRWAVTDPLTGLGNRRALDEEGAPWECGYVAMIDVDSFKLLNDRHGHGYGDEVLRDLGTRLARIAADLGGGSGAVGAVGAYRVGGDEFVLAARTDCPPELPDLKDRIAAAMHTLPVTVSVGVSVWSRRSPALGLPDGLWSALTVADRQMYGRKRTR